MHKAAKPEMLQHKRARQNVISREARNPYCPDSGTTLAIISNGLK